MQIYNYKQRHQFYYRVNHFQRIYWTCYTYLHNIPHNKVLPQHYSSPQALQQTQTQLYRMSSIFNRIANSFSTNNSKKLFMQILACKYDLQAKFQPVQLKRILKQAQIKQLLIKQLSTPQPLPSSQSSPQLRQTHQCLSMLRSLKKICTFHHIVLYYNDFAELIEQVKMEKLVQKLDQCWFITNVIKPYICFLQKYCLGIQMFNKLKLMPVGSKQSIFQCMCYAINMFKSLFSVVSKLPAIGRYFRDKNPKIIDYFVELMAYHAQTIYQGFRSCISQIISFSKDHLARKEDEVIFKEILSVDLMWVNEEMKKLFLDKYFYPYGKGYGVKLYRIEDQNEYQTQVINGILSDHQNTERQKQARMLEETLFPTKGTGKFSHQDLERSFSYSLSKLEYLRKDKKEVQDPQKDDIQKVNKTMNELHIGEAKKRIDFMSAVKTSYVEEVEEFVEDV